MGNLVPYVVSQRVSSPIVEREGPSVELEWGEGEGWKEGQAGRWRGEQRAENLGSFVQHPKTFYCALITFLALRKILRLN